MLAPFIALPAVFEFVADRRIVCLFAIAGGDKVRLRCVDMPRNTKLQCYMHVAIA